MITATYAASHSQLTLSSLTFLQIVMKYKFGVLYCKEGQTTEEEWFGNGASHNFLILIYLLSSAANHLLQSMAALAWTDSWPSLVTR